MAKTETIHMRIAPEIKNEADNIFLKQTRNHNGRCNIHISRTGYPE